MEVSDALLWSNRNWDPCYLRQVFEEDFNDFSHLWETNISDNEIVMETQRVERYCPVVEDISVEGEVLCNAVEKIEQE